jgi:hypothetical protein
VNPPISFFIPPSLWPDDLPNSPNQNWAGYGLGIYAWTVQTYLQLTATGIACQLTRELPQEGIVLCHSNVLRPVDWSAQTQQNLQWAASPERFLICIKAEAALSAIAPMHIVQNPAEASPLANRYFIPHWPQPQLLKRSHSRGDRFENLAFLGHDNSLAAELKSPDWQNALAERGLCWQVVANTNHWNQYHNLSTRWNDYRDIDAIVAVRSFDDWQQRLSQNFSDKPATKLYNAWLSKVIPILGPESAYRQTGERGQDYLEVTSFTSLLNALDRLQADEAYRRSLLIQGHLKAQNYTPERTLRKWQVFLEAVAIPAYTEWRNYRPWQRQQVLVMAQSSSYLNRISRRSRRVLLEALSKAPPPTP